MGIILNVLVISTTVDTVPCELQCTTFYGCQEHTDDSVRPASPGIGE